MKHLFVIACLSVGLSSFAQDTTTTTATPSEGNHHQQMMQEHGGMGHMNSDSKIMKRHARMMAKCAKKMGEDKCKEMSERCKSDEYPAQCMRKAFKAAMKAEKK